jgi:putative AdoMet-dependent methyltransferase
MRQRLVQSTKREHQQGDTMSATNPGDHEHGHEYEHANHHNHHNHHHRHHHHHHHHHNDHGHDVFADISKTFDTPENELRAKTIAHGIVQHAPVPLTKDSKIMDFGAGTGLVTQQLAPHVGHITVVDVSPAMLEILRSKSFACDTATIEADLVKDDAILSGATFDCIVAAMALHHVQDLPALFARLAKWTAPNGCLALADLDKEDGSFHSPQHREAVVHHGLDREELERLATQNGFHNVAFQTVDVIKKEQGEYPIFLMTATRAV